MYYASRLLSFLTQPLAWAVLLMACAVVVGLNHPRRALVLNLLALSIGLLAGWLPLADGALRTLEVRYSKPTDPIERYEGVIVLGGGLHWSDRWTSRVDVALSAAGERPVASAVLAARYPHLKVIYAGNEGPASAMGGADLGPVPRFYRYMGVAEGRVIHENSSRTTLENAENSVRLPGIDPKRRWLLLTSAAHMRRAMLAFERAGWNVTPYPVDFRAGEATPWTRYSLVEGAAIWQIVLHETIGRLAYSIVM